ncbi:MAG: VWA domain-containing protein [Planctomycetes bacterium]|nr:VWA domain-containing protein [Planctomycetota bacterium]
MAETGTIDQIPQPTTEPPREEAEQVAGKSRLGDSDTALIWAWAASLGVHLLLFSIMVALPWINERIGGTKSPTVTTTDLHDAPKRVKFAMSPVESPFARMQREKNKPTRITPDQQGTLRELSSLNKADLSIVGIGTGGGEFSKYGLNMGGGHTGPQFFGLGGEARSARRIIYVVDRSGSMMGVFEDLRKELKRSIDRLRKSQKYHVVFYSTDPPIEAPPNRLVNAIRASKSRTFDFIDQVTPEGMTQPIEAMRRAFRLKPDLIYFLSDGDIPEAELLKENLIKWNRREKVKIFTISYVSAAGRQLLEEIARTHNGQFRFVSEHDLGG